ncbi:reverse transcriptase domain-containing protein [Tanacetum coccineum]|uniref:Reverse transcriptase domain-containing protein n=1 Tax=Tanacetum coccineum TaxID=301880 RepID=A0ABQ5JB12_9ASTR
MQNSHSNNDACFRVDVIDEVTKEELDALVNDSEPFLKEEFEDNFEELPLEEKLRIKTSIQDLPTDLEMKPLPKHLEYAYLKKDSLIPIIISALLKADENKRLVSVLKHHKEVFAWKTSDILEVVKKEIIKLLDAGIIYPIEDSPWVSLVHCVPKKEGMTVVTNEKNEPVTIRTVTRWRLAPGNLPKVMMHLSRTCLKLLEMREGIVLGHNCHPVQIRSRQGKIQNFSKISRPMTKLLEKDLVFDFNKECIKAFEMLTEKLMNAPIMISPDWSQPFELMCDASDFAIGAVLGQREGKQFHPIYFAIKTLNNA